MVFVASSNDGDTGAAVGAVIRQLRDRAAARAPTNGAPRLVLAFHSIAHDPQEVARRFHEGMPGGAEVRGVHLQRRVATIARGSNAVLSGAHVFLLGSLAKSVADGSLPPSPGGRYKLGTSATRFLHQSTV